MSRLLIDTCAALWIGSNASISVQAIDAMDRSADQNHPVFLSPYSAWEIGLLASKNRIQLPQTPSIWFSKLLSKSGAKLAELTVDIFVASSYLPSTPPRDPADRIIIATAREYGMTILTRDQKILKYANEGHVKALAC